MFFVDSPVARKDLERHNDYQIFYLDRTIDESCSNALFLFIFPAQCKQCN